MSGSLDNDPLSRVRTVPLYRERYVLITHEGSGFAGLQSISWAKAATVPLCLLTPSMQNRRIIDMQFHTAGAKANAFSRQIPWLPSGRISALGNGRQSCRRHSCYYSSKGTDCSSYRWSSRSLFTLGLLASAREPLAPLSRALLNFAEGLDLTSEIERRVAQ
jgi:hypothetical protein